MQEIIKKLLLEMESDICELQMSTEKADTMANIITNDYFSDLDPDTNENKSMVCYYFNFACKMHDILCDYIYEIKQHAKEVNGVWEKMFSVTHDKNNNFGGKKEE